MLEKARGAGINRRAKRLKLTEDLNSDDGGHGETDSMKRPELVWINALVTVGVILLMCLTKIPLYGAFMIGLAFALAINLKRQGPGKSRFQPRGCRPVDADDPLTTGVFIGVLKNTKMMDAWQTCSLVLCLRP